MMKKLLVFLFIASIAFCQNPVDIGPITINGGVAIQSSNNVVQSPVYGYTAIGDSITACFGVVSSPNCYINRIATAKNWTVTNQGVSGDGIAEMSARTFVDSFTNSSLTTFLCCVNDMRNNGSAAAGTLNAARLVTWAASVQANLIQASIPETQKIYGNGHGSTVSAVTYTGTWAAPGTYSSRLFRATAASAKATVSLYGSTIYIISMWQVGNTSTYKISVDGVDQSFTVNGVSGVTQSTSTGSFTGFNGATFGPYAYRLTGLSKTLHSIDLTCLSADASNPCYFLMAASASGASNQTGPFVFIGDTLRFSGTGGIGYATNGGSDAAVAAHNSLLRKVQSELALDGLPIVYVNADVNSASGYYPLDSVNTQADGVHPSDVGHGLIANAFLAEMSTVATPKERGAGQILRGVPACTYAGQFSNGGCIFGSGAGDLGASTAPTKGTVRFGTDGAFAIIRNGSTIEVPSLLVKTGISTAAPSSGSTGFQHKRTATCSTTSTQFNVCNTTVTWASAFADTSYTATCTLDNANVSGTISNTGLKATTTLTVGVMNMTSGTALTSGTVNCIAVHD